MFNSLFRIITHPLTALILGCIIGALQTRGLLNTVAARLMLGASWLIAVFGAATYLVEGAPVEHRILAAVCVGVPFAVVLIVFEIWMTRQVRKKENAEQEKLKAERLAAEEAAKVPDPIFSLVARPGFRFLGLIKLDTNYIIKTNKNAKAFFPLVLAFENHPIPEKQDIQDIDQVWARLSYKSYLIPDLEMASIATGVWVDEPLPDITFPVKTPKHLVLGGWELHGKKPFENKFWLFEYSRERNRVEKKETHFTTPQHLMVEILLTSNGYHHLTEAFRLEVELFDVTMSMNIPGHESAQPTGVIRRINGNCVT